jgi:hypothetical protein
VVVGGTPTKAGKDTQENNNLLKAVSGVVFTDSSFPLSTFSLYPSLQP